ncbi:alpha/beta-hydrolase [Saccharata proteae CBS 121410]|uniref:Carboxylic ester hydrolase n=1 Tax=Saccharata proteae CBS 121410 TaxID=1314787 RepID=A0A9P4HSF1_9PEZI|nr:alpha/beta-hydrolase [Saccharata proteae CBS 121410]
MLSKINSWLPGLLCIIAATRVSAAFAGIHRRADLPIVDLGYEQHQAIDYSESGGWYNFSNIRYGEAPVGNLRFREPVAVSGNSSEINNGSVGRTCPQASGAWTVIAREFAVSYEAGETFNYTAAEASLPGPAIPGSSQYDDRTTEDCLFLDVYAPLGVFDGSEETGLPVLIWLFGGGFTSGEKNGDGQFDPSSLMNSTTRNFIFVAVNYRLGAFGWLAGPSLQANGTANAGLYDQLLAFNWVQQNIQLFGGDPDQVTVMGKSAGAGSLMHQITAFGGEGTPPFQQAILSSPAFQPVANTEQPQEVYEDFLSLLGVSTIGEARELDSETLIAANAVLIYNSTYGSNSFGPVVDGIFSPAVPGQLLLEGSFYKDLKVMVGHNLNEALLFTDPRLDSIATYDQFLDEAFPTISNETATYIESELYPPVFNGTYGYTTEFTRAAKTTSDFAFVCNTNYLDRAFDNLTYAYEFSVTPGIHGQDTVYIFPLSTTTVNQTIAQTLRDSLTSFVIDGVPTGTSGNQFPLYDSNATIVNLTTTGIYQTTDDTANNRCVWWQKGEYA